MISQTANSQEEKAEKKLHIKVITVEDGEESTFDTTFNAQDFDNEAFKKEMKEKYGIEMGDLEEEEGVEVKVDSEKADALGIESRKETKKVVVIKEVGKDSDEDLIWEEKAQESEGAEKTKKVYIVSEDGEKFTIEESGEEEKVIRIMTEDGEQKIIQEGDDKKVILITEEGETKVLKGEGGEKVIIIKSGSDQCEKSKKDKKAKEKTIKVIVVTDEDEEQEPEK